MSKDLSNFIGSSYLFALLLSSTNSVSSIFLAFALGYTVMYCLSDCEIRNEK